MPLDYTPLELGPQRPTAHERQAAHWSRARRGGLLLVGLSVTFAAAAAALRLAPRRPGPRAAGLRAGGPGPLGLAAQQGPYACGVPLAANQTAFVLQEYAAWKKKYVMHVGGSSLCIVRPIGDVSANTKFPKDCVSEGIGYGMLLAAYLADRDTFDGLWSFSQQYLDQNGIMHWQIHPGGPSPVAGNGGATDADEDIAMALLVASERWGESYMAKAKTQIDKIWQHEIDQGSAAVKPGDSWGSCSTIDPSYFSPAWYKVFGKVTGRAADWRRAIDTGFGTLSKCNARNGGTGLTPQWTDCNCGTSPNVGKYPDKYWCDSVRVPLRMAISAAWHCDERAKHQAQLLAGFFGKQGPASVQRGYTIQGQPFHEQDTENSCTSNCFVVTAATTLVTGSEDMAQRTAFWQQTSQVPGSEQSCYFCDVLRMLALLFTSGLMPEPKLSPGGPLSPSAVPLGAVAVQAPPQALPQTTPQAVPQATPQSAPQSLPQPPSLLAATSVAPASPAAGAPPLAKPTVPPSGQPPGSAGAGPLPAQAPASQPSPAQRGYKCGVPLNSNSTVLVLKEYDAWKKKYLLSIDGSVACIMRPGADVSGNTKFPRDCVSEGTGYGMLLAAYLADRGTFDALWQFSQKNLDQNGLMNWQIWPGHPSPVVGKGGATDADEDIAMALLVAAERWGAEYRALAKRQIDRVWRHEVDHGASAAVRPGDSWGSCKQIDPSYFSPAWYRVFGAVTGKADDWNRVIDAGFTTLAKCNGRNRGTGLTPQWTDCNCASSPAVGKYPEHYWCDSVRVPLRMAVSAAWHCDPRATLQTRLLAAFFARQGSTSISKGYTIQGEPLQTSETEIACSEQCFVVTAAAAFVTGSSDLGQRASFWRETARAPGPRQSCYFCDVLRMISLLFTAGLMTEPRVDLSGPLNPSLVPLGAAAAGSTLAPTTSQRPASTPATTTPRPTPPPTPPPPPPPPQPAPAPALMPTSSTVPTTTPRSDSQPAQEKPSKASGQLKSRLGLCLEAVRIEGRSHEAKVSLAHCDSSTPGQHWHQAASQGPIVDTWGNCLDATYGIKSAGMNPVGTLPCLPKSRAQAWGYSTPPGSPQPAGFAYLVTQFAMGSSAVCLRALAGGPESTATKLQVCNASDPGQQWKLVLAGRGGAGTTLPGW